MRKSESTRLRLPTDDAKTVFVLVLVLVLGRCMSACADSLSEANAHYRAGRYDEAVAKYGDAQGKNADPALVHFNLGDAQYRRNKFDEAVTAYERTAGAADPLLEAKARYNIGNCRYRQGKLPEALESYKKAIEFLSGDPDLGSEGRQVLADAQANYEFVQNKIKEEAKAAQQQPQDKNQKQDQKQQQQSGDQKKDQQQQAGEQKQEQQTAQSEKDKQDRQKKEQQAQALAQKDKKEEKSAQEQKDGKDKAQKAEIEMTKEEAARLLDTFGQFEDQKKIEDKFRADEQRPAKDW